MEDLDNYEAGQPIEEPMTESQRNYIEQLVSSSSLTPDERKGYLFCLDVKISYEEAQDLIAQLKKAQRGQIDLARDGKLKQIDLGKALQELIRMPNT